MMTLNTQLWATQSIHNFPPDWDEIEAIQADLTDKELTPLIQKQHILWMIIELADMPVNEKSNRWVGFVQGVVWSLGRINIDELRAEIKELTK